MCYSPITIPNPSYVKNQLYSKRLIEVPCNHCFECKEVKRLSWFVRLYYAWKHCQDVGGFALYETFTYNNAHVPICCEYFDGLKKHSTLCFSRRDIQLYMKRLRKALHCHYPDVDINGKVKYFFAMEYGGKTHRPHYHPVFFVETPEVDPFVFKNLCESLWHENGFTKSGGINNGFVTNCGGLSYVAKYVTEDVYEDSYLKKLEYKLIKQGFTKDYYKDIFPRVMCSNNLGISAFEFDFENDLDTFMRGSIYLPDNDEVIKKYKLPLYYERKIFYDVRYRYFDLDSSSYVSVGRLSEVPTGVDYTPIYVLNELGLEMKEKRAKQSLDAVTNVYRIVTSMPESKELITKLNVKFNTSFKSLVEFQDIIKCELPEDTFVSYSLVYRGLSTYQNVNSSPCCSTPYYDYMLINNMSRGLRPLSIDRDNLISNISYYSSIPNIEDNYKYIRYMFILVHYIIEQDKIKNELNYVDEKTAYLRRIENIV